MARQPDLQTREDAYRLWAKIGNASKVAKEMKINIQTIHVWKKQDRWEERKARMQDKLAGQLQVMERAKENLVLDDAIQGIKLLSYLEEEVAKALITERVVIQSWKDVIDTMKFIQGEKRMILGEPTSRTEIEVKGMSEKDLDDNIKDLMKFAGTDLMDTAEIVKDSEKEPKPE